MNKKEGGNEKEANSKKGVFSFRVNKVMKILLAPNDVWGSWILKFAN